MVKRYINCALIYAIIAMACGVFFREYTKFSGFEGVTNLSFMHTHYFVLGMVIFLILALFEKSFGFSSPKHTGTIVLLYHIGLNLTAAMLFIRGLAQVSMQNLAAGTDSAISGISGIGHALLGLSIILLLLRLKKQAGQSSK